MCLDLLVPVAASILAACIPHTWQAALKYDVARWPDRTKLDTIIDILATGEASSLDVSITHAGNASLSRDIAS